MRRALALRIVACALASAAPRTGWAESAAAPAPPSNYSAYEAEIISEQLAARGQEIDPQPEGKIVEGVDVVRLEVFDDDDPVPDFLNVFHVTTLARVIERELLFGVGDPYQATRVAESARNLRDRRQLSVVLIVPVRGSAPDRVRALVITKDVWSLRLNSSFAFGSDGLSYLLLNPSEENAFGTHASLGGLFVLFPESFSVGLVASHRRVLGTRIRGSISGNLVYNRDGTPEGSYGSFAYGQPLYASHVDWAWGAALDWSDQIARLYEGSQVKTFDAEATPEDDALRIEYDVERQVGAYQVTRSFGLGQKYDFTAGAEADRRNYESLTPPGTPPEVVSEFEREWLPVSDTRVSPFVQFESYSTRFLTVLELETLGLQEDYRLGTEVLARLYPASSDFGSTRDMLGTMFGVSHTEPLGDGLVRGVISNTIEYELHGRHDASVSANLRLASPRFGLGRLIVDGALRSRYFNYLRRKYYLGGDGRLRGYAQNQFFGAHAVAANAELRTRSIDILSAQVGMAAFYDVGHAAQRFDELEPKQSVGIGVRVLFPQANREVFRFDWGLPLSGGGPLPGAFFVTIYQAFSMPELEPPTVTSFVTD